LYDISTWQDLVTPIEATAPDFILSGYFEARIDSWHNNVFNRRDLHIDSCRNEYLPCCIAIPVIKFTDSFKEEGQDISYDKYFTFQGDLFSRIFAVLASLDCMPFVAWPVVGIAVCCRWNFIYTAY
jgi:hypothetical protein